MGFYGLDRIGRNAVVARLLFALLLVWPVWIGRVCGEDLGPVAVAPIGGGAEWLVAGASGRCIIIDARSLKVRKTLRLPGPAGDLVVRGRTAWVSVALPAGRVLTLDLSEGRIRSWFEAGHMPGALALTSDGRTLCVANRFLNSVRLVDLQSGTQRSVKVVREPFAMALGPGGRQLFVANLLPEVEPALDDENPDIAAVVSVIDVVAGKRLQDIRLPNGSHSLRGIVVSPDGKYAVVVHVLSNYMPPPERVDGGAMNRNVLSVLDARTYEWINTLPLDDPDDGAANPWAVAFARNGRELLVTHAGTNELSEIDYAALLRRASRGPDGSGLFAPASLRTMTGIRTRVPLGCQGARAMAVANGSVCIAGFFSDEVIFVDGGKTDRRMRALDLSEPGQTVSPARRGERFFNDAALCRQRWQSCATCHPDGRRDSMYWDLHNDGLGNFKDSRSLLMSALTPPVMWRGVRPNAAAAIRAGMHHILFSPPRQQEARAIEAYLRAMSAVPGPALNAAVLEPSRLDDASCAKCHMPSVPRGKLTGSGRRGKALFKGKAGCATCHPHPLFTTLKKADPGLGSGVEYDIPSLVEVWRTAPYLHNGDGTTLRETITDFNFQQKRGFTKDLSPQELDDLITYLRSL